MSLLSRWFASKTAKAPKVSDSAEQLRALDKQTPQELAALATTAESDSVRAAAIAKLDYSPELLQLALHANNRVQLAARKRLGELLEQNAVTVERLAADLPQQADLVALTGFSRSATLAVIDTISDSALLLQLACEGKTTQVRQAAAARITDRNELEHVGRHAQSKDKSVYKIVKSKLDAFKADDALRIEAQVAISQVCEKLEKLARLEADALFKAKVDLLIAEGDQVAGQTTAELRERYTAAVHACQQQIVARAQHIAREEEQVALDQQASAFVHTAITDLHQLIAELYAQDQLTPEQIAAYQQQLADLNRAITLATGRDTPLNQQLKTFEAAHQHAARLLASLAHTGTVKQLTQALADGDHYKGTDTHKILSDYIAAARGFYHDNLPEAIQTASATVQQWSANKASENRRITTIQHDIAELTRKGLRAAQQGMVRKARGSYKEVQEKCAQLAELPTGLQNKVDELHQAIARLSDWHDFAVTPKKKELIAQMQGLSDSRLSPADLAEKIHELQDEWKSLSRGVQQDDEALWQEFQQASQIAFAPCKDYFDAQAQARAANLEKRRELISQLESYLSAYDWTDPIWSDVEKTLKVARQEWQSYWPVPRKAAEGLQATFNALMDQLYQKIKDHQRDNKTAKLQLIEQAQAFATAADLAQAIEQTKRLQAQWKTIGKTFAKEDQQLWLEFRKHCDAVFARRAEEVAELNQQRQAQIAQAEQLIMQVDQLGTLPFAELSAANQTLAELTNAFAALHLPKEKARELSAKFDAAVAAINNKIAAGRNAAAIQGWQDLFSLSNTLRQYELAVLAQAPDLKQQHEALGQQLNSPPHLPAGSLEILQQRFAAADQLTRDIQQQNKHQLQLLCIRAEIIVNKESPEADRTLRMNYLMQQLQQGLGQREETTESLAHEWVAVAAVTDDDYQPLFVRFMEALSNDTEGQLATSLTDKV